MRTWITRAWITAAALAAMAAAGCKSDLNQQLLERELRYQEDQIYKLQDELQAASFQLESAQGENVSLRRQLGVADDTAAGPRRAPVRAPAAPLPAPVAVPRALEIPDSPQSPSGAPVEPPGGIAPPSLEGVPPLPTGAAVPAEGGLSLPAPVPAFQRLAHEEVLADDGAVTHLVVNPDRTVPLDADGDGTSDGLTVVFEPRDADERLVAITGPVSIAVFDAAAGADPATGEAAPIARWEIPAEEAAARFRRTSRARGVQLQLPWQGRGPAGDHVRVAVRLAPPAGGPLEADATIAVR